MRPLYAIAPLALLLTFVGPTPNQTGEALAAFKSHVIERKPASTREGLAEQGKPALINAGGVFSAMHLGPTVEGALPR